MPDPRAMPVPSVCLVGMGRSGSNSLRAFFDAHPQIAWRRHLRSLLFDDGRGLDGGEAFDAGATCTVDVFEWYCLGNFRYGLEPDVWPKLRFETPGTLEDDRFRLDPAEAADRLHEALPRARILFVLREQADWLLANYRAHALHLPRGRASFDDFLQSVEGLILQEAGHYDRVLQLYLDRFEAESVHVVQSEAFRQDPEAVLAALAAFLGVEPIPMPEPPRSNAGAPPALVWAHRAALGIPGERRLARWISGHVRRRGTGWADLVPRWLGKRVAPFASSEQLGALRDRYAESNRRTAELADLPSPDQWML